MHEICNVKNVNTILYSLLNTQSYTLYNYIMLEENTEVLLKLRVEICLLIFFQKHSASFETISFSDKQSYTQ